jgi:hypothetical protein
VGTIINIIRINLFILINYLLAVEELDNGLNEYPSKLNENISTAELIKTNLSTPHDYAYLIIEIRLKIEKY